jgi:hypothetical protein
MKMAENKMSKTGHANKRKGIKVSPHPKAPHDPKTDGHFGNRGNYADVSKTKGMNKTRGGASPVKKSSYE